MELLPSRSLKYNSPRFTMDCILWWVNIKQLSYLGAPNHTTQAANVATLLGRRWSQRTAKRVLGFAGPMGKWWGNDGDVGWGIVLHQVLNQDVTIGYWMLLVWANYEPINFLRESTGGICLVDLLGTSTGKIIRKWWDLGFWHLHHCP